MMANYLIALAAKDSPVLRLLEAAEPLRAQPGGEAYRVLFLGNGASKPALVAKALEMGLDKWDTGFRRYDGGVVAAYPYPGLGATYPRQCKHSRNRAPKSA